MARKRGGARSETIELKQYAADSLINLALDTLAREKQALVFCNTKRGAESQAEKFARKITGIPDDRQLILDALVERVLGALDSPTKQCHRLALCIRKGVAFHHAGLHTKQRDLIEDAFRNNSISIICSTPTLAMGLDMPAFRSIVRDVKRFTPGREWGMAPIPVLEYHQMAGRAGRPGQEEWGEAIMIAKSPGEADELQERYQHGEPEEIYSKLAVEPALRTYLLSLIATGFIRDREGMYAFFDDTFYAYQYANLDKLHDLLDRMMLLLEEWEFIKVLDPSGNRPLPDDSPFMSADEMIAEKRAKGEKLRPTPLGERVAQLYLDPLTAAHLIRYLKKATGAGVRGVGALTDPAILQLLCTTMEMRPLLRPKQKEYDLIDDWLVRIEDELLVPEPVQYSYEYEDWLAAAKTTMFLLAWINEAGEDSLLERYNIRPGEIHAKKDKADWLLYSCEELCKLLAFQQFLNPLAKMRIRLEYGVREELLNLLRIKGIGKKRARVLYKSGMRSVGDIKKAEYSTMAALIGPKTAANVKEQVGQTVDPAKLATRPRKRKGQKSLGDWKV